MIRKMVLISLLGFCAFVNAQEVQMTDSLAVSDNGKIGKEIHVNNADEKDKQIEELKAKMELYDKVEALEKEVKRCNAAMEDLKAENEDYKQKIKKLEDEKSAMQKQMKESQLKKEIKSLKSGLDGANAELASKNAENDSLRTELAEKEAYIARLDAFRVEFERAEVLALAPLLGKPFSQVELAELEELQERVKPFTVDSLGSGYRRENESESFKEYYFNLDYYIANKKRFLLCDSLLARPLDVDAINSLFAAMDIEKEYLDSVQYAEFETKFELLKKYGAMAVELGRMIDEVNIDPEVEYYRGDACDVLPEQKKDGIMEAYAGYKLDESRFDGLVYLSQLYTRYQSALEIDYLKQTGELEAVELEIGEIVKQSEAFIK